MSAAQQDAAANPFRYFWDLGYRSLLPVLPHDAIMDENSPMVGKDGAGYLGKAPGVLWRSGKWGGFGGWAEHETTEADIEKWFRMGASVGLRLDDGILAIDIDASDPDTAQRIENTALDLLGFSPCRVGRAPRRALLYKLPHGIKSYAVSFAGPEGVEKVEISSTGKQIVVQGIHPKTRKHYAWPRKPVALKDLTAITTKQLAAFTEAIESYLPEAKQSSDKDAAERGKVDQNALKAKDPELLCEAIRSVPNSRDIYPDRDDYIRLGVALKAALPDDPLLAFDLWCEWAEKDDGGTPNLWEKDWKGIQPPYALGAQYVYDQAVAHGWDGIGRVYFDAEAAEAPASGEGLPNLFKQQDDVFPLLSVADLMAMPEPKFLIDRHVTEKSVGFVYGDPGVGKSFVTLDWALHLASGAPDWHGDEIERTEGSTVVYLAGEGVSGYRSRISAWLARHPDADPNLAGFKLFHEPMNFMSGDDVGKLIRTLRSVNGPISMVIVDTVSRTLPGAEENSTKEMSLFVAGCTKLSKMFDCAVVGVHHTNKTGGMRGSTTFPGGADFIFKLERKKGSSTAHLFCEKQKDAPDGWSDMYQLENVCIGVDAKGKPKSSLVVSREAAEVKAASGQAAMLDALERAWLEGRPWSDQPRSQQRYAPRIMSQNFDVSAERAHEILSSWMAAGVVVIDTLSAKAKTKGLRRVREEAKDDGESAFD